MIAGNTSGGTDIVMSPVDIIKASSGGCQMSFSVGAVDDIFDITTDNGGYTEAWFYGDTSFAQM